MVRANNAMGDKDCTLALNFGGPLGDEENIPAKVYEQPELKQPDPATLILVSTSTYLIKKNYNTMTKVAVSVKPPRVSHPNKKRAEMFLMYAGSPHPRPPKAQGFLAVQRRLHQGERPSLRCPGGKAGGAQQVERMPHYQGRENSFHFSMAKVFILGKKTPVASFVTLYP